MIYPASDLDQPEKLLALLGSFWSETYTGQDFVQEGIKARADLSRQTFLRLQEAADALSRLRCPVFRKEYWHLMTIKESERGLRPARYGLTPIPYGVGGLTYGAPNPLETITYPAPTNLADVQVIFNRLQSPSASLFRDIDFRLDDGYVVFAVDPFTDPRFSVVTTVIGDETVRELDLWLFAPDFDRDYVHTHWGFVINVETKSSQVYKDLVNDVLDMNVQGTAAGRVESACCRIMGLPPSPGGETVLEVSDDSLHTLVLTDKSAHLLPIGSTSSREVGEVFYPQQSVSEAVKLYEFNRVQGPRDLPGVVLGRGFLVGNYIGELSFVNRTVPLESELDANGRVKVTFEVGGHPADVEQFWNYVHAAGLASGQTLAQRLDTRDNPTGDPDPAYLPATVNPLGFMLEHLLRNNAFVVRLQIGGIGTEPAGLEFLGAVSRMVSPHTAVIFILEADAVDGETLPEDDVAADAADGADPVEDETGPFDMDNVITGRVVSGQCQ